MLNWLKKILIGGKPARQSTSSLFDADGNPVRSELGALIAVLMMETARADSDISRSEIESIYSLLEKHLGLSGESRDEIMEVSVLAKQKPERIELILSDLREQLDAEQRAFVFSMLWKVVLADGKIDSWEEKLIQLAAERLELSASQIEEAKTRASGEL